MNSDPFRPSGIDPLKKNRYTLGPMNTYQIKIGGETFPIKSDASEEHVLELAQTVQDRYEQMNTRKGPRASQGFRAMAMVALVILDELRELQNKHEGLKRESLDFANGLSAKIDSILSGEL